MNEQGRGTSKRLRFESEAGGGTTEGTTSGQLGPKSTPGLSQKDRYKRRTHFEDEAPPHGVPPTDNSQTPGNPHRRLRFEKEDAPESALIQDKPKSRLRFEDEDSPDVLTPEAAPGTSGQVDPKLKQQSQYKQGDKNSAKAENLRPDNDSPLRHDDEAPAFRQDSDTPPGGSGTGGGSAPKGKTAPELNPQAKKQAAKDKKLLDKTERKVDKTGAKLDKAKEKLAAQKPINKPGLTKQLGNKAKFATWAYVHKKIHQVEHENVGIEAAHKTELAAEGAYRTSSRFVKRRIRSAPARRVKKFSKRNARAKANHAYQKLLQENPALRKKTLARFYHKQRLKMRYARQANQVAQGE